MNSELENLMERSTYLMREEKAALIRFLVTCLDRPEVDEVSEEEFSAELARRGLELETGRVHGLPADKMLGKWKERFGNGGKP